MKRKKGQLASLYMYNLYAKIADTDGLINKVHRIYAQEKEVKERV